MIWTEPVFDSFYRNEFVAAKDACGYVPEAKEIVDFLKEQGGFAELKTYLNSLL